MTLHEVRTSFFQCDSPCPECRVLLRSSITSYIRRGGVAIVRNARQTSLSAQRVEHTAFADVPGYGQFSTLSDPLRFHEAQAHVLNTVVFVS